LVLASPAPLDLAEEIRSLIKGNDLARAVRRLLDYAKQFSGQQEIINSAIIVTREVHSLQKNSRRFGDSADRETQTNRLAHRILEIVDEIEAITRGRPPLEPSEPKSLRVVPPAPESETVGPKDESDQDEKHQDKSRLTSFEQARQKFVKQREAPLPSAALEARGLSKKYRGGFSLTDVDLSLKPGEIIGLVGVNGSGKTTLLRVLAGELAIGRGDLEYPLLSSDRFNWVKIKSQIAFVPQRPPRWYGLLEENLYLHAALRQITGRANEDEVEFILHRLGLERYRKARWDEISGGFQMRFELAKALVGQPKLLILDEPLAPLDINTQQVFLQDLRDIASSSANPLPIILSSQHIYEVEAVADSILFLDNGAVVFYGSLEELYRNRQESTYEITSPAEKGRLLELLEPLGVIDIEHTGLSYIVNLPKETTGHAILDSLLKENIEVRYFRDISGSSRKLFKGRGD